MKPNAIRISTTIEKTYIDFSTYESIKETSGFRRTYTIHTASTQAMSKKVGFHVGGFCDDRGIKEVPLAAAIAGYDNMPSDLILCKMGEHYEFLPLEEGEVEALYNALVKLANANTETKDEATKNFCLLFKATADFSLGEHGRHHESSNVFLFVEERKRDESHCVPIFYPIVKFLDFDWEEKSLRLIINGQELTLLMNKPQSVKLDFIHEVDGSHCVGEAKVTLTKVHPDDSVLPGKIVFHFTQDQAQCIGYDQVIELKKLQSVIDGVDSALIEGPDGFVYGVFIIDPEQGQIILYRFPQDRKEGEEPPMSFFLMDIGPEEQTIYEDMLTERSGTGKLTAHYEKQIYQS